MSGVFPPPTLSLSSTSGVGGSGSAARQAQHPLLPSEDRPPGQQRDGDVVPRAEAPAIIPPGSTHVPATRQRGRSRRKMSPHTTSVAIARSAGRQVEAPTQKREAGGRGRGVTPGTASSRG